MFAYLTSCLHFRSTTKSIKDEFAKVNISAAINEYEAQGRTIRYLATGNTETTTLVVFLHGSPGSLSDFTAYMQDSTLRARAFLLSPDRAGYGFTSGYGQSEILLEKQAAALVPLLEKHGRGCKKIIVGYSFGAPVAARLAMDYPQLVDGLVLVAGALDPENEKFFWFSNLVNTKVVKSVLSGALRVANDEKFSHPAELRKLLPLWETIKIPVTIIQGGNDGIVLPINATFAQKVLKNATVTYLTDPAWTHIVVWSEKEAVTKAILSHF